MIKSSWGVAALLVLATMSTVRAACDDIDQYLSVPSPMTGDMEINLDDVDTIECEELDANRVIEEIVVDGGTLTLKSSSNVGFVNVGFTVMSGAALVFDMPKTKFGPNPEGFGEDNGYIVDVEEGGSVTFLGRVVAKEVSNVLAVFGNDGTLEFKKIVSFTDCGNVFRYNTGTIKFRGIASFTDNKYLAIENIESGYIRFSKAAIFDDNGSSFDGARGCSVTNFDSTSTVIFASDASFSNHNCDEGGAVFNGGVMKFNAKASFDDNEGFYDGAGLKNMGGSLIFKGAVQFNNNAASFFGGGLSIPSGDVTFQKAARFTGNSVGFSGAAFAVLGTNAGDFGTLTFKKPDKVFFTDNFIVDMREDQNSCTVGEVVDGATLVGFPDDDVCVAATE